MNEGSSTMETAVRPGRRENRRDHILAEATRIVAELGYHGFGLQELADRCGMTKPGLLHHFGSKENMLLEVLKERDHQDEVALASASCIGSDITDPAKLSYDEVRLALHAIVARNATQPELVRLYAVLRSEALSVAHPAHAYFVSREAYAIEQFALLLAPHVDRPEMVARELVALMSGLELQWLREEQGFDLVEAWDYAADRFVVRSSG